VSRVHFDVESNEKSLNGAVDVYGLVVLITLTFFRRAFLNINQNGGTVQDDGFLAFYFRKIAKPTI
jgi:hypothetical protein